MVREAEAGAGSSPSGIFVAHLHLHPAGATTIASGRDGVARPLSPMPAPGRTCLRRARGRPCGVYRPCFHRCPAPGHRFPDRPTVGVPEPHSTWPGPREHPDRLTYVRRTGTPSRTEQGGIVPGAKRAAIRLPSPRARRMKGPPPPRRRYPRAPALRRRYGRAAGPVRPGHHHRGHPRRRGVDSTGAPPDGMGHHRTCRSRHFPGLPGLSPAPAR